MISKEIQELLDRVRTNSQASTNQSSQPEYKCHKCKDKGYTYVYKDGYEFVQDCECMNVVKYQQMYKKAGIAKVFENCTFDNFTIADKPEIIGQAKKVAQSYVKNYDRMQGIALLGQVGSGKTHLCIAIANELLKQFVGVLYMQYREVLTHLKQNMLDEHFYQNELYKYKNTPVLYIDDLFKGKVNETDINIMFEIINFRYLNQMPIIVSSEYSIEKLLEFDEAIGSRIIQMCKGYIVELEGVNLNHRLCQ